MSTRSFQFAIVSSQFAIIGIRRDHFLKSAIAQMSRLGFRAQALRPY
ncbi:hypothetical protein [Lusitaniella coriacea]